MKAVFENPMVRIGGLVIFTVAGFAGWRLAAPKGQVAPPTAAVNVTGKRAERLPRDPQENAADEAGKLVASVGLAGSPEARLRAAMDLAYSLSPDEFAKWLDGGWFTVRGGPELMVFTGIVVERWKQEDEKGLLAWLLKKGDAAPETLIELARKDPHQVLAHFRENPDAEKEIRILAGIAADQPDLVLARLQEIIAAGRFQEVQVHTTALMRKLAEKDPAKLAAAMAGFSPVAKLQAEIGLSYARMEASFADEVRLLLTRPDGWKIFEGNLFSIEDLGGKLVGMVAELPPSWRTTLVSQGLTFIRKENAEAWWNADLKAAGFSPQDLARVRSQAFSVMIRGNPVEGLRLLEESDFSPSERSSLMRTVIANVTDNDKAREMISQLESETDRASMSRMLEMRIQRPRGRLHQEVKLETPEAWLTKAEDSSDRSTAHVLSQSLRGWDKGNRDALAAAFQSMDESKKFAVARTIARCAGYSGGMPEGLAGDALVYLMENPKAGEETDILDISDDQLTEMTSTHALNLSLRDPDAAAAWVDALPASEMKSWAQRNLYRNWRMNDPDAAEQWEKSLPAADREALERIGSE